MKRNIYILFVILLTFLLVSCSSDASSKSKSTYTTSQFQDYLSQLPEEEENGEQTILKAYMEDDQTITIIVNNDESGTYSNMLLVDIYDTAVRSRYKDSEYYMDNEPIIKFYNSNNELIYEGNTPVAFNENDVGGF